MPPAVPTSRPRSAAARLAQAPDLVLLGAAACLAVLLAAALIGAPMLALVAVAAMVLAAALGVEALIVVCFLGACGLLPYVDPQDFVVDSVKVYALLFAAGAGLMLVVYSTRILTRKSRWPFAVNALSAGLVVLLAYVVLVGLASHPLEVPALSTPFFILPISALATLLWLSHEDAIEGLIRAVPLVVGIVAAWALVYDAGAAGCGTCRDWVGADLVKEGLLGDDSRLYTSGQNSFLGLFLIAFAWMLVRPSALTYSLVGLGALTIALQTSRAQYLAVMLGVAVLLAWKMGQLRVGRRTVLIAVSILALIALASSPAGDRAASVYTDLQSGTGTGAYRIERIEATSGAWTVFGQGFSNKTLELGYDIDLGLPNTLLVLGYVGAFLQILLLGLGIWRGMAARTIVGTTIAAILLMVLLARPSLPLLEYGHASVLYGAVLGFAAALGLPARVRRRAPLHQPVPVNPPAPVRR